MSMQSEQVPTGLSGNASMASGSTWQEEGVQSYSIPASVAGSTAGSDAGDATLHTQDGVAEVDRLIAVPEGEVVEEKDWTALQREFFAKPVYKFPSPQTVIGQTNAGNAENHAKLLSSRCKLIGMKALGQLVEGINNWEPEVVWGSVVHEEGKITGNCLWVKAQCIARLGNAATGAKPEDQEVWGEAAKCPFR